ncbi:MAG: hypothetical protein Q8K65_11025 [Alphaproteobacteria bacterium]|nr:hypothetical protein [Alphaproteobacteria bacterium]
MTTAALFGLLSVAAMIVSRLTYFRSIWQGKTQPHAFSWFIWGVISSIGFAAQFAEGAGAGSWARGFGALTCFVLVGISLFRGEKNITRGDWITLIVALSAIPLWILTKTPLWSVILVCVIDTAGYLPTIRKSWSKPQSESALSYSLGSLGALLTLLAIENYTMATWLYPAVLVASNGAMALFLLRRRLRLATAVQTA